jgi:16S rRNA (cytosine1402-N4)-methyltransferase
LAALGSNGRLLAIDRDPAAIAAAPEALRNDPRFELIRGECAQLEQYLDERQLAGKVDGILLDLGVSSPQLDDAERGFSFLRDGPLDMRMDPDKGRSAAEWLAEISESDLRRILKQYGEETHATRIARAIVEARSVATISRTGQLAGIISAAVPAKARAQKKHPATKSFQAIRIAINEELQQLERALRHSLRALRKGGRLCVISFHSLEDRMVKRFMRDNSRESEQYRGMPNVPAEFRPALSLVGRAVIADNDEIASNVRSRSARLRIAERC